VSSLVGQQLAFADHPVVTLTGSNFEIDVDANLRVDHASPSIDWASVGQTRVSDTASGSGDESFGQGTKEDTAVPTVVTGGIPPNKSDLKEFGLYQEGTSSGGFLHLYWSRVQDPKGTTNMDFEFNQSASALDQRRHAGPDGRRPADHLRPQQRRRQPDDQPADLDRQRVGTGDRLRDRGGRQHQHLADPGRAVGRARRPGPADLR
jgi:hypothetical protein